MLQLGRSIRVIFRVKAGYFEFAIFGRSLTGGGRYFELWNQCFFIFIRSEPSYKKREPEVDEKELEKVRSLMNTVNSLLRTLAQKI